MNIKMETYSTNDNSSVVSDYDMFGQSIMVRGSEALKMLGLSRHNLERCVENGYIRKITSMMYSYMTKPTFRNL